mgnify:CR=1 FL=1
MKNPWEEVSLSDYENHMSLDSVMQLQTLNSMMKQQFESCPCKSIMILGIAGGNGLEHINPAEYNAVYGIDVNNEYLQKCSERYPHLNSVAKFICADLTDESVQLPEADFVVADLLIEYIGYKNFQRVVNKVNPQQVSCVIQINTGDGFVSDSPYLHAFDGIESVHNKIDEDGLVNAMKQIDYLLCGKNEEELPNGKKLLMLDFSK